MVGIDKERAAVGHDLVVFNDENAGGVAGCAHQGLTCGTKNCRWRMRSMIPWVPSGGACLPHPRVWGSRQKPSSLISSSGSGELDIASQSPTVRPSGRGQLCPK